MLKFWFLALLARKLILQIVILIFCKNSNYLKMEKQNFLKHNYPPPQTGKSLYNSTLQLLTFGLLILSSFFLFNACNKDALNYDESINLRDDSISNNLKGLSLEFYNWYINEAPKYYLDEKNYKFLPFDAEIDWQSSCNLNIYGSNSLAYSFIDNPIDSNEYNRCQVLFLKEGDSIFMKTLVYFAESDFYTNHEIVPNLDNFTGYITESSGGPKIIDKVYYIVLGILYKTVNNNLPNANISKYYNAEEFSKGKKKQQEEIQLRQCGSGGCWNGKTNHIKWQQFWYDLLHAAGYVDTDWTSWYSDNFGWSWEDGGWQNGGGAGTDNGDGNFWKGSGGSGGSGGWSPTSSNPWGNTGSNKANYDCAVENYKYLQENHPEFLNELNFWVPCSGMDYTLSALQYLCSKTNNNPSANNDEIWQKFMDKWRKMRAESISDALECQNCALAFEKFEDKYDITLTEDQKKAILENTKNCLNQSNFNETTLYTYLKDYFGTGISEVFTIDNIIFAIDVNGILRIKIPKIDMQNSSNEAIFNQFLIVLNAVNKYYCQTKTYKPIDWRDYFIHCGDKTFTINWNGCTPVALDFATMAGERFITDTQPSWQNHSSSGDPRYYYELKFANTNIRALRFTLPYACEGEFYDLAFPQCN